MLVGRTEQNCHSPLPLVWFIFDPLASGGAGFHRHDLTLPATRVGASQPMAETGQVP
ncbi:hypothetical protein SAMN05192589_101488 [Paracidovorax valerianellae]|uniref:Uncharacterized protein n=1 Tax=Paracidovorax valerianellae TaxID=187868 RepID=A0A1G6JUS2_9BURK|nr:hypothetical protein SAMN05192589_101488 [Paracidovorax valerianellae]